MRFNQGEWVNDMVIGAVVGMVTGLAGAIMIPVFDLLHAVAYGGITGLLGGMTVQPVKWVLERRPHVDAKDDDDEREQ